MQMNSIALFVSWSISTMGFSSAYVTVFIL